MKRIAACAVFAAVLLVGIAPVKAQEGGVKIIGHSSTTPATISQRDLTRIFLKQRKSWPSGASAEPVDQSRNARIRRIFSEQVLERSVDMVESHWQAQVFSGKATPPPTLASDQEVIDFVRSNPGAVGYISPSTPTSGVQVVTISK
jgi:hypothetical protein